MSNQSLTDTLIVIVFLIICLIIGLYRSAKIKTLKEFAIGYKNITVTVLVCIIFSSSIGAASTIGITGKIYDYGSVFVFSELFIPLSWLTTSIIVAKNIEKFKGCISLGEIMHKIYGLPGRWITALVSIIRSLGAIAAQALAMGIIFNYFFGVDKNYGILIGYGIITIYSALGGIRAVIHTEIFKFVVFFLIIPISYIFIFSKTGGLENFITNLPEEHTNLNLSQKNLTLIASFAFFYLLPNFSPNFIQRCLIAENSYQLKKALNMIALISLPFSGAFCLIAYKMHAFFPNLDSNEVLLKFITLLPPILKGLMIAGIIAIIMSLAEAKINATSVILVNDVVNILYPNLSNAIQLIALRFITIILSVGSLAIINSNKNILDLVWMVANFWDPIIVIPASAGFLGFRTNSRSFIVSVLTAILATLIGRFITNEFAIMSWCLGIIGSAIGLFGTHYWQIKTGLIQDSNKDKKSFNLFVWLSQKLLKLAKQPLHFMLYVLNTLNIKEEYHKLKIREFCTFTLSYYFIFSLHVTSGPGQVVFAYLISTGYALCLLLLFREFVFTKRFLNRYLHLYWHFLLTFCLPFVSSYMLFSGYRDDFWLISGILSFSSLYFFVDARRFIVFSSIGALAGYILYRFSIEGTDAQHITAASKIGYVYIFFLFTTLFFLRRKEKEQEEKIGTMEVFSGAMAHEVKSPLATLNMCAQTIDSILNKTFQGPSQPGKYYVMVEDEDINTLKKFSDMLKKVSKKGISTVDGLLLYLRGNVIADDVKEHSILECVTEALSEHDHFSEHKVNIDVKINDFRFHGSKHYIKHVLFNLISNAYKYGGRDVKVKIWTKGNQLHFKDYGKGIDEERLPRIFERFYTNSKTGTGIGLAFCKKVMEDMGGDIECNSELGKYTHFTLHFPKLKKKKV
jgi:Na+/proline symporter/signal transduction histidine kinase